ncbi:rhamnulokinase [Enterococcus sp. 8G7_MSG3316]|uniref:Rhamnulokinase n=1 Tax=Candidatus Enterococcus testudinis TaxID=1834191 RepID=A0A242A3N6_9ENTE|nr:rhamnulokinase [Enterococcus sp. 8G7_MSG3316]OTN75646.1 rhamnulokinase [Enterococcus sp. 8G7_MSG3316]
MDTFIAIDIGASSGRLMMSQWNNQRLSLTEIHRFKNRFRHQNGFDRWQIDYLIKEILLGLVKVKQAGIDTCHVGIDTWAVDYCLVDENGTRLGDPVAYRDKRTNQVIERFGQTYSLQTLYEKTGIQLQPFNTIFQLYVEEKQLLAAADKLLLIPDYLGYVFTGNMVTEKTNASTMQLLNATTQTWDPDLLAAIGVNEALFAPLVDAGTVLGALNQAHFPTYDLPDTTFITIASHDTASAILGTPGNGTDWGYISSGTWSLLGIETTVPTISAAAFDENYTNEWGAHNTIRFLKNIMGMWLIQEVARQQENRYSFPELAAMAETEPGFQQFIDVNDPRFLNPDNMIAALQEYCRETKQKVPETPGEIARCVYDNLALCYGDELQKLAALTGTANKLQTLHIVGGGSNNAFLNQLTANVAQCTIEAGPSEATAIGNLVLQMMTVGLFDTLEEARMAIKASFPCTVYQPEPIDPTIMTEYQFFLKGARHHDKHPTTI